MIMQTDTQGSNTNRTQKQASGKVTVLVIERAIKEKKIDIVEFATAAENECYLHGAKISKRGNFVIDLSFTCDRTIIQRLCEFYYFLMVNPPYKKFYSFRNNYIYGFNSVLQLLGQASCEPYETFILTANRLKPCGDKAYSTRTFINAFTKFCAVADETYSSFDSDDWAIDELGLTEERQNPARKVAHLTFIGIQNEQSKKKIKSYIWHLLMNTNLKIKTIAVELCQIKKCSNFTDKSIDQWTDAEIQSLQDYLFSNISTHNAPDYYFAMKKMFNYLYLEKIINDNPFPNVADPACDGYKLKNTAPDMIVVQQIFTNLHLFQQYLAVWFLIAYCTGARGSDITSLRKNCLSKNMNSTPFVRQYGILLTSGVLFYAKRKTKQEIHR